MCVLIVDMESTVKSRFRGQLIKGYFMRKVLAECSASISELKKNPSALIAEAAGVPVAILNHNVPTA